MNKLSYLNLMTTDPAFNLAAEQYVFDSLPRDRMYFLLWQNDNAVIIGKYQNTYAEINASYVQKHNIKVVRRKSGGGAVYHDLGNLNYTIIADAGEMNTLDLHLFCQPVVNALAVYGINASITGRNDITIDGKKFSGNSQYLREGRVMHHGTILFNSNLESVGKALQVHEDKIKANGAKSVRSRVTNVSDYLKVPCSLSDFRLSLLQSVLKNNPGTEYTFTQDDLEAICSLKRECYDTWEWNYGSSKECSIIRSRRIEGCGTVEIHLTLDKSVIQEIKFYGDFFSTKEPSELEPLLVGCRYDRAACEDKLHGISLGEYFTGINNSEFITTLFEC